MSNISLFLGGARSGKSSYAVDLARNNHKYVVYLATGIACDAEMTERIKRHKNDRPETWKTIEEPLYLENVLKNLEESTEFVLLDCLGFWVSNLIFHYQNAGNSDTQVEDAVLGHIKEFLSIAEKIKSKIVIVSNEVGMGVVPESPLGRLFRDILGRANQTVASCAEEVLLFVAGLHIKIK